MSERDTMTILRPSNGYASCYDNDTKVWLASTLARWSVPYDGVLSRVLDGETKVANTLEHYLPRVGEGSMTPGEYNTLVHTIRVWGSCHPWEDKFKFNRTDDKVRSLLSSLIYETYEGARYGRDE